jgi:hypothetical protein
MLRISADSANKRLRNSEESTEFGLFECQSSNPQMDQEGLGGSAAQVRAGATNEHSRLLGETAGVILLNDRLDPEKSSSAMGLTAELTPSESVADWPLVKQVPENRCNSLKLQHWILTSSSHWRGLSHLHG